jgi:hypothetical protein
MNMTASREAVDHPCIMDAIRDSLMPSMLLMPPMLWPDRVSRSGIAHEDNNIAARTAVTGLMIMEFS